MKHQTKMKLWKDGYMIAGSFERESDGFISSRIDDRNSEPRIHAVIRDSHHKIGWWLALVDVHRNILKIKVGYGFAPVSDGHLYRVGGRPANMDEIQRLFWGTP